MRHAMPDRPGLHDVWERAGESDPRAGATFRGMGLRDRIGNLLLGPRRIDYVFYRPQLTVERVRRIDFRDVVSHTGATPSDHYPVLADFRLAS
jgi:endonuclease/exonuclease/phosphatase family metal-dependent hydrolase